MDNLLSGTANLMHSLCGEAYADVSHVLLRGCGWIATPGVNIYSDRNQTGQVSFVSLVRMTC